MNESTTGAPRPPLRFGVIADAATLTGPIARRRELLARTADAGISHVFMADHVSFWNGLGMDGLVNAATIAATEERLGVYVGVYLLALRHPMPVARQIATLAESAPGRLTMGIGVGGEDRHEIEVCEVDPRTRGRRTSESLDFLRQVLKGEPVDYQGEFFQMERAHIAPPPDPAVPFIVGGRADAALRRAGELGDGWLGVWSSARRFAQAVSFVEDAGREAGRNVAWDHGMQYWLGCGADLKVAEARLARRMENMYQVPYDNFRKYAPCAEVTALADFLAEYAASGCRHFNVNMISDSPEYSIDVCAALVEELKEVAA